MSVRACVACALAAALVVGCGGSESLAPRPRLGVQSNEDPIGPITLRVQPPRGARYRTAFSVELDAHVLGRTMELDGVYEDAREVIDRRPDGTTVISARATGGSYRISLGEAAPRESAVEPSGTPVTTVMDARGRTIDDAMFGPSLAGGSDRSALLRAVVDPLLDAVAYPEASLAPGEQWRGDGTRDLAGGGNVRYELVQTLVRVEGSGASALAVISVRGRLEGSGLSGDGPTAGELRFDGVYTVAIADGLVRGMQTRVEGRAVIGGMGGMDVPFEGTLRYRAE